MVQSMETHYEAPGPRSTENPGLVQSDFRRDQGKWLGRQPIPSEPWVVPTEQAPGF